MRVPAPLMKEAVCILLAGLLAVTPTVAAAGLPAAMPAPPPQNQTLGSLTTAGDVFANNTRVPGQVTIVAGDDIRVGEGMATFTATGERGSLAIFPQSELVFSSDPRFAAELRAGRAGMRSSNGPSGVVLRAGNYVLVASAQGRESAATVDRLADNSFLIACTEGSVGIVPLGGGNGLYLQAGQSARITPTGQLVTVTPAGTNTPSPNLKKGSLLWLWVLLGAGAGGGAIAAIIVATHKSAPVTPVAP